MAYDAYRPLLGTLIADGIWVSHTRAPAAPLRPGLFLDRDGVLIADTGYIHAPEVVELLPGAAELLVWRKSLGIAAVVVTNQSGIARRLYAWDAFEAVQAKMETQLAARGAVIDLTIACPFHPELTDDFGAEHASWRKPGGRMLRHAASLLSLSLAQSWMIGDRMSDCHAARAAGLAGAVLIDRNGEGGEAPADIQLLRARDLHEARELLQREMFPASGGTRMDGKEPCSGT